MDQDAHMRRIIENLSSDLNNLSSETKRKYGSVKEASEACLLKLRHITNQKTNLYKTMCDSSSDVIKPFILGCETKQPKIIQICLASVQKVIEAKILNSNSASMLINILWQLTDSGMEELKVLQTIILLVTTTDVVKHQSLAKILTIGLRIAASKDQIVMNTATAMLSQMITKVLERVLVENKQLNQTNTQINLKQIDIDQLKILSKEPPSWMKDSAQDAYMLLQDIYLLLNSDQSLWLININDINKPFGLEILKQILVRFPELFFNNPEMSFLLKERICPLLIKLFSPSTKIKLNAGSPSSASQALTQSVSSSQNDQKSFGMVSRLIRIVFVLIKNYFELLITESEIFLSLLTKFLELDRPLWQKALAIEVFHKISTEPTLIEQFVLNYDMKQQPEKVFALIMNGIALFMQSLFLNAATNSSNSQTNQNSSLNNSQVTSSNSASLNSQQQQQSIQISSAQPSFVYKDTTLQLLFPYTSGQVKSLYLEGWDKLEIPYIQDGYLLSICFSTLQEICKSVQLLIEQNLNQIENKSNTGLSLKRLNLNEEQSNNLKKSIELLNSCSNSFLFVYNILLESSLDETITEQIIKSIRTFIHLTSILNLNTERDAFVTSLCKAALPSNYAHNVLNLKLITDLNLSLSNQYQNQYNQSTPIYNTKQTSNKTIEDSNEKQIQVVAVGPALNLNQPHSTLYITTKNLLTMKSILNMSSIYSELLGSSWYIVLNTLQHLTWTLGLKPTIGSNGQLKHFNQTNQTTASSPSSVPDSQNSMIFTAIQTDVAFICNLLTKLFESTRLISDQALLDVIDSLLKLSIECSDLAYLKNEPCLFPVAKLYETSISNLNRIDLFWQKVTMHFLCGCKHGNLKYREWCVDSICNMIRATFNYRYSNTNNLSAQTKINESNNRIIRDQILQPLDELSSIQFNDVRQKQIECTLSILRLMGQHLNESWPLCLNIIGAIQKEHTDILIRSAFQCLQLVVTDFLSMIKAHFLSLVINVVSKFGSQEQDLNISLTAIVLLWNISDFMFQKSEDLNKDLKTVCLNVKEADKCESIEAVWMVLYSRLGHLCVDPRPAVRKSACQTLFCTISSHGSVLNVDLHWKDLVWSVLFPLLEQVRHYTNTASRERDKQANHPNFLMHHSRDTAEKQWAETSVLTLSGVTRVFNSKCALLMKLSNDEFHKMWLFLLNIIESFALSRNSEISLSALRGFHELLGNQNYFSSASSFGSSSNSAQSVAAAAAAATVMLPNGNQMNSKDTQNQKANQNSSPSHSSTNLVIKTFDISQWLAAWKTWLDIGNSLSANLSSSSDPPYWPPPGQTYLTCYVDLVFVIVDKLAPMSKFTQKDFENFSIILDKLLTIPVLSGDHSSFILMQTDTNLTPLQNSALNTMKNFIKLFKANDQSFQNMFISLVFQRLLSFVLFACYSNNSQNSLNGERIGKPNEIVNVNYVPFGERALVMITSLYEETASNEAVIENSILKSIIQTLYIPLSLKYSCPNPSTWKLSVECLFKILKKALPITFKNKSAFETMWLDLANTFEDFLFSKNIATSELPLETIQKDEMIDCQMIELIRDEILTHASQLPQPFIQKILAILNRGSIYSNTFENFLDLDSTRKLREEFSKACFETLLRFSFINANDATNVNNSNQTGINSNNNDGNLTRMALTSMLNRCKEIIQKYAHDERLNGNIPLPKARTNEMISVLKALCTLINALKKAPKESVQLSIWNQVIGLYPCLVECTTSPSTQICAAVRDALHHYFSLLKTP